MSETNHESRRDEIAAYLLGALEPEEAASLERHLASGCVDCRAEMRWLEPAVQMLPDSVERVEPSRDLRARILSQAEAEAGNSAAAAPARRPLFTSWRPLAGVAVLVVVLAAAGGYALSGGNSSGGTTRTSTVVAGRPPGVTATVVSEGDAATLRLANVHDLPQDKVLEAWVRREGQVLPVRGLFVPDRKGRATTRIPDTKGVDVVMVTAEPRGGSDYPTSIPLVTVEMPPA